MTESKTFKRRVRARMEKTGESYTSARRQLAPKRERIGAARSRLSAADDRPSEAAMKSNTGKTWDQWFAILDRWGGTKKKHGVNVDFLMEKHGVPGWWAQAVTVYYERARGLRVKHQNAQGFSISATKTVNVPVGDLFHAFVDDVERKKWFEEASLSLRTAKRGRGARFDWEDGTTRVVTWFEAKGPSKSTIALAHEKLRDADEAETMKAMWRARLVELKSFLES